MTRRYLSAIFTTLTTDVDGVVSFPYVLKEIKLDLGELLKICVVWTVVGIIIIQLNRQSTSSFCALDTVADFFLQ